MASETSESYQKLIEQAAKKVKDVLGEAKVAIVLGSGLGNFVQRIQNPITLPYNEVPGMPIPTVAGHAGKFVGGKVGDVNVYCMAGRLHRYEGIPPSMITFSVRIFACLGVETYIATNAAGGAGEGMRKGDIMSITSHVNFSGFGPLDDVGVGGGNVVNRVPECVYSQRLMKHAKETGKKLGTRLQEGVYWCNSGPTYETSSEVRAGVNLGTTAFGMSTVPEAIVANSLGMEVCAFSLITNMAAGLTEFALSHEEVSETASSAAQEFEGFMESFLSTLPSPLPSPNPRPAIVQEEVVPLPSPLTLNRGEEEVKEGVEKVREKLGLGEGVEGVVAVNLPKRGGVEGDLKEFFGEVASISLKDIPNFPTVSKAARRGVLISLPSSPLPTLLLLTGEEGLNHPESTFLSQLLSHIPSLHSSLHLFPSILLPHNNNNNKEKYVVFTDLFPYSTAYAVPEGGEGDIYSSVMQGVGVVEEKSKKLVQGWELGEGGEGKCAFGANPLFPSMAEASIFKQIDCNYASVCSPSLLFSLRFTGLSTIALTVPPMGEGEKGEEYEERFGKLVRSVLEKVKEGKIFKETKKYRSVTYKNKKNTPQINHNIVCPFPSVKRETVVGVAGKVKERLREKGVGEGEGVVGVVVDEHLGGGWEGWGEVEGWVEYEGLVEGAVECSGKIAIVNIHNTKVLFIKSRSLRRGDSSATVTAPIRLMHELGVKYVVGVASCVSCNPEKYPTGSNLLIKDYVNLSQRNALFGENEKEWGVRFLDQQQLYNNSLLSFVGEGVGEEVGRGVGGYVVGPVWKGDVMKNYLVESGVEVAAVSVFPETVAAHHMNDTCVVLGVVTDNFSSSSSSFVPSWEEGGLKDMVVKVCGVVQQFAKK